MRENDILLLQVLSATVIDIEISLVVPHGVDTVGVVRLKGVAVPVDLEHVLHRRIHHRVLRLQHLAIGRVHHQVLYAGSPGSPVDRGAVVGQAGRLIPRAGIDAQVLLPHTVEGQGFHLPSPALFLQVGRNRLPDLLLPRLRRQGDGSRRHRGVISRHEGDGSVRRRQAHPPAVHRNPLIHLGILVEGVARRLRHLSLGQGCPGIPLDSRQLDGRRQGLLLVRCRDLLLRPHSRHGVAHIPVGSRLNLPVRGDFLPVFSPDA